MVDTLRADAIYGVDGEALPGLSLLTRDGVPFENCFSHSPTTLPSHTALFSSRPPFASGVLGNGDRIPGGLPLLAEELRDRGYTTACATSIGALRPVTAGDPGLTRGFDVVHTVDRGIQWADETYDDLVRTLVGLGDSHPVFFFAHFADPHYPYRAHGTVEREVEVLLRGEPLVALSSSMSEVWEGEVQLRPGENNTKIMSGGTAWKSNTWIAIWADSWTTSKNGVSTIRA